MAEAEVQDGNGDSSSTKTVVIIIVVVALAALGFYLLSNRSTEELTGTDTDREEVITETEEEGMEDTAADLQKLRLFKDFAEQVESILSNAGKESLQVVVVFVEASPESLDGGGVIPDEVVTAAESVWAEVQDAWGNSVVVLQESIAVVPGGEEGEEVGIEEGDVVTLDGPIELTDIESPLGPVFSVVSNANGQTYYLVFDKAETERVMTDLLGQEVIMEVEVTAMNEDGTAGFTVVDGPTLVE